MQSEQMTLDLPDSAKAAREAGSKFYFTGKACKHGHVSKRATATGNCYECASIASAGWAKRNMSARNEIVQRWRENNREQYLELNRQNAARIRAEDVEAYRAQQRQRYKDDPEYFKERERVFRAENAEVVRERDRQRSRNPNRIAQKGVSEGKRRAIKANGTLSWLTADHRREMAETYRKARSLTGETGIVHHVDHIEPLKGKNSCGLHVPWNLQILTAEENLKKGNRLAA